MRTPRRRRVRRERMPMLPAFGHLLPTKIFSRFGRRRPRHPLLKEAKAEHAKLQ